MLSYKELEKIEQERAKAKQYCTYCGHTMLISARAKKKVCNKCGHLNFKNEKEEFKHKLKIEMIRRKREEKNNGRKNNRRKNEDL